MAGLLHGCARTTPCVRAELQASQASTRALAARYGLNPKTVAKWRERSDTADAPMGPRRPRSTVLTEAEEAAVIEFRRRTLLPLDDVLGCLRESIPRLTRSALHRCLQRHGISRLPRDEMASSKRKRFAETRIGYVHVDSCELRSAEGKVHMFLAIDRVSKFAYVELHATAEMATGAAFMRGVVTTFPYRIHTVLTDNGVAFTRCAASKWDRMVHPFDRVCDEHGIKHKLTKPYHPWTNGQAERMNRTVKEATVKTFHYETLESSRPTGKPSWRPTTSPSTSRRCDGGHPSRPSATPGRTTPPRSRSTRTTSSRDQTPSGMRRCASAQSLCSQVLPLMPRRGPPPLPRLAVPTRRSSRDWPRIGRDCRWPLGACGSAGRQSCAPARAGVAAADWA